MNNNNRYLTLVTTSEENSLSFKLYDTQGNEVFENIRQVGDWVMFGYGGADFAIRRQTKDGEVFLIVREISKNLFLQYLLKLQNHIPNLSSDNLTVQRIAIMATLTQVLVDIDEKEGMFMNQAFAEFAKQDKLFNDFVSECQAELIIELIEEQQNV